MHVIKHDDDGDGNCYKKEAVLPVIKVMLMFMDIVIRLKL